MSRIKSLLKNTTAIVVLAIVGSFSFADTNAQEIGDRVVVTASTDTKIYDKVIERVHEGNISTVEEINGKWCKLDRAEGWLLLQNVMNLDMGLRHFSKRIKDNPRDSVALAHRGVIFHELERFDEAFTDLDKSLAINRKNAVTWMLRGIVLKSQGKLILASKDLNEALSLNPKLPNAHFNMALILYAMEDYPKAIEAFDAAIKLEKKKKHALWYVSRGSAKLGIDDLAGASEDYKTALDVDPRLADSRVGLSNIALLRDDLESAFEEADKAVEIQPKNAMALNARGWVSFKLGKVDEAIYDLNRAIRYAPRLSIAYGNRGVCHVSKNEFDRAIADHTRHLKLTPNNPFALANRAVAWLGKGEFEKAKMDYEAAQKIAPELDEALNGYAWFLATCPDEKYRNGKLAIQKATKACEISKNKDWYHLDTLASAYAEELDFENAVKYAQMALDVAPESKRNICQQQLERFQRKEPFRSQVGKNAEQSIISGS
ncbi:MAG: tetratricopeptide repeat protein [Planctomycetota bacterium]